ncbi:MAG: hypothetical protein COW18_02480 [Zetaproteobacteria bacterium CG12_big_fil_rev_8_21_14_0_65_54_13]|nr:MAG: hypothetical protein AUJ57_10740 [Zetaproteobacteria bacterium CG1_02_53_45]PIP01443.1 MAG: hypothetical protein COX55_10950 [Zetaproteobacteria bacterium CG23_combo_of_CG06-09_8_20_14_all_54_7]PIW51080.1 MAG: hypothetical protein COW18_02480 [Zetaproteobacteria bacterium CG12_big_fil_rev_8_21_14_0_65_54_13]PIX55195.1 MAG: hypothetical protein COZ50_03795 [Zetaproteobacteria bacterium CG_4_10_14_3_um_filter_54_28]PJA28077.1 MAG: hypothetical protein CO188_10460 [Zetaproteobacteria bacte
MNSPAYRYNAFGLNIHSHIELPALPPAIGEVTADVFISIGPVSASGLEKPNKATPFYQSAENILWLNVPDIARFLVRDGNSIVVDPYSGSDEQSIRLYLLGSCMGAILHQRGVLVMHGNAVRFGDRCVVFAGHSGAGKSTLAAAFHKRGHEILADDVCAIDAEGHVAPSFPQLKLWQDAAKRLSIDTDELNRIRLQVEKYAYPLDNPAMEHLPVAAIYILNSHNRDEFEIESIRGMQKFNPLKNNTYRVGYLDGLGLKAEHLGLCSKLAGRIHLSRITRPNHGFKLDELVEMIMGDLRNKGIVAA